ncbi:MAG: hypothetical protein AB7N80_14265 [Bdellovibrionales bacterium]
MNPEFMELKTTDNTTIYVRKDAVGAFEVVPPSQRVDGHIKVFIGGFKFLVVGDKEEIFKKLAGR